MSAYSEINMTKGFAVDSPPRGYSPARCVNQLYQRLSVKSAEKRRPFFSVVPTLLIAVAGMVFLLSGCGTNHDAASSMTSDVASTDVGKVETPVVIELYGKQFESTASTVDLTDCHMTSADELLAKIGDFTDLQEIDVTGCEMSNDDLMDVQSRIPGVALKWNVRIFGVDIPTTTQSIEFRRDGNRMGSICYDAAERINVETFEGIENIAYLHELTNAEFLYFYGSFDLSLIKDIQHIKSLFLMGHIDNVTLLGEMTHLKSLSVTCDLLPENSDFLGNLTGLNEIVIYFNAGAFAFNCEYRVNFEILKNMKELHKVTVELHSQRKYLELVEVLKEIDYVNEAAFILSTGEFIDFSLLNQTSVTDLTISQLNRSETVDSLFSLSKMKNLNLYDVEPEYKTKVKELRSTLKDCQVNIG